MKKASGLRNIFVVLATTICVLASLMIIFANVFVFADTSENSAISLDKSEYEIGESVSFTIDYSKIEKQNGNGLTLKVIRSNDVKEYGSTANSNRDNLLVISKDLSDVTGQTIYNNSLGWTQGGAGGVSETSSGWTKYYNLEGGWTYTAKICEGDTVLASKEFAVKSPISYKILPTGIEIEWSANQYKTNVLGNANQSGEIDIYRNDAAKTSIPFSGSSYLIYYNTNLDNSTYKAFFSFGRADGALSAGTGDYNNRNGYSNFRTRGLSGTTEKNGYFQIGQEYKIYLTDWTNHAGKSISNTTDVDLNQKVGRVIGVCTFNLSDYFTGTVSMSNESYKIGDAVTFNYCVSGKDNLSETTYPLGNAIGVRVIRENKVKEYSSTGNDNLRNDLIILEGTISEAQAGTNGSITYGNSNWLSSGATDTGFTKYYNLEGGCQYYVKLYNKLDNHILNDNDSTSFNVESGLIIEQSLSGLKISVNVGSYFDKYFSGGTQRALGIALYLNTKDMYCVPISGAKPFISSEDIILSKAKGTTYEKAIAAWGHKNGDYRKTQIDDLYDWYYNLSNGGDYASNGFYLQPDVEYKVYLADWTTLAGKTIANNYELNTMLGRVLSVDVITLHVDDVDGSLATSKIEYSVGEAITFNYLRANTITVDSTHSYEIRVYRKDISDSNSPSLKEYSSMDSNGRSNVLVISKGIDWQIIGTSTYNNSLAWDSGGSSGISESDTGWVKYTNLEGGFTYCYCIYDKTADKKVNVEKEFTVKSLLTVKIEGGKYVFEYDIGSYMEKYYQTSSHVIGLNLYHNDTDNFSIPFSQSSSLAEHDAIGCTKDSEKITATLEFGHCADDLRDKGNGWCYSFGQINTFNQSKYRGTLIERTGMLEPGAEYKLYLTDWNNWSGYSITENANVSVETYNYANLDKQVGRVISVVTIRVPELIVSTEVDTQHSKMNINYSFGGLSLANNVSYEIYNSSNTCVISSNEKNDIDISDLTDKTTYCMLVSANYIPRIYQINQTSKLFISEPIIFSIDNGQTSSIGEALVGAQLELSDSIGMNMLMSFPSDLFSNQNAYVKFIIDAKETNVAVSDALKKVVSGEKTYYIAPINISVKNMCDTITIQTFAGTNEGIKYTYSATEYAKTIILTSSDTKAVALCKALLNYATYSQEYFGYKTNNKALDSYYSIREILGADKVDQVDDTIQGYGYTITNTNDFSFTAMNLELKSKTTLCCYFGPDANTTNVSFSVDGNELTLDELTSLNNSIGTSAKLTIDSTYNEYCVAIYGINPNKLGERVKIEFNDTTLYIGVMDVCKQIVNYYQNSTDQKEIAYTNLAKAIYVYYNATCNYAR